MRGEKFWSYMLVSAAILLVSMWLMHLGDLYVTRHSNIAAAQVVLHLAVDAEVRQTDEA